MLSIAYARYQHQGSGKAGENISVRKEPLKKDYKTTYLYPYIFPLSLPYPSLNVTFLNISYLAGDSYRVRGKPLG